MKITIKNPNVIPATSVEIGSGDIRLLSPVQGLFKAPIRTASGNFSGRDDGYVSSQFFASREIVINGLIPKNCNNANALLCQLQDGLPIRQALDMYIQVDDGTNYFAQAYFIAMEMDVTDKRYYQFQITMLAPDHSFYIVDPTDPNAGWVAMTFEEIVGGGYVTPYVLPVEWRPSSQPTIINNPTSQLVLPQIILQGKFTNPRVTNITTGKFVELAVTTSAGDEIVIDMRQRIVTLNGGSILPSRSGSWWGLINGNNYIELKTASVSDDKEGIIRYRLAYNGIFEGVC